MSQTKAELINAKGDAAFDTDTLYIDSTNNRVGVGTTSPQQPLHIKNGGSSACRLLLENTGSSAVDATQVWSQNNDLVFNAGSNERARIDSSGRLLVGTSSQTTSSLFTIKGNSSNSAGASEITLQRGEAATSITSGESIGHLYFTDESSNKFAEIAAWADAAAGSGDYPGRLVFSTTADGASSPTERMRINNQGVVIFYYGVYAPQLYTNSVTGRDVYVDSNGQLGYLSSTQESKINIQDLSAIDWIYSLSPKSFNYRKKDEEGTYTDEFEQELEYGLIAEEVEVEAPDICFYNEKEDGGKELAGVSYRKLIAPLIKAVQELKAENEALHARVTALESQ